MTTTMTARRRRTWWQLLGYIVRRATLMEIHGYLSIYRSLFRRPKVPAGAVGFSYHQPVLAILIVFLVLSTVELVVVDIVVRRWDTIRIPLLVVGIWGLVYMVGLLLGMLNRPHAVGPEGIGVCQGSEIDIPLGWADISSVTHRKRTIQDKQPKVTVEDHSAATLHLRMQGETNVVIQLERALPVRLPSGTETVTALAIYADDPQAFVAEASRHR